MFNAHEAESVIEAAVQRAEVAEGALRRVDAVEHKIAKLQRKLRKWAAVQKKVSPSTPVCYLAQLGPDLPLPPLVLPCPAQLRPALCSLLPYALFRFTCAFLPCHRRSCHNHDRYGVHNLWTHSARTSRNAFSSIAVDFESPCFVNLFHRIPIPVYTCLCCPLQQH